MGSVSALKELQLAARLELLYGILADRLQHPEARLTVRAVLLTEQALGGQRRHPVQDVQPDSAVRVTDRLGCLQRAAADEDPEASVQCLLLGAEQVVAPGDRVAEGLLARRQVACTAGQQR